MTSAGFSNDLTKQYRAREGLIGLTTVFDMCYLHDFCPVARLYGILAQLLQ